MTGLVRPNGQEKRHRVHDREMRMPLTDQRTDTLGCVPKIQEICVTAYEVSGSCPAGQVQVGLVFWITLKSELAWHILKERRDAAYASSEFSNDLIRESRELRSKPRAAKNVPNFGEDFSAHTQFDDPLFRQCEAQTGWTLASCGALEEHHAIENSEDSVLLCLGFH